MRVRHALAALAVAALTIVPLAAAAAPTPVPGQGHVQNQGVEVAAGTRIAAAFLDQELGQSGAL